MIYRLFNILLILCSVASGSVAQVLPPDGGGNFTFAGQVKDEISPQLRSAIIAKLKSNVARLNAEGKLPQPTNATATAFGWITKQAPGYNDNGAIGISNYVDENPAFPNAVLDYNCGNRSYDLSSGYNHKGTDIFLWPFYWQKMSNNEVQVVAGAAGTIIGKDDGNFDQNCSFCTSCNWNAVYIQQADGSVAWYGHMKAGTLTSKSVGQTVAAGEFLGIVGSSGSSTAPHVHFEVYTNNSFTQLVDPWAGPCNNLNGTTSWWASQQPYYVPTINKVMTHGNAPAMNTNCPGGQTVNEKRNFSDGDSIWLASYFRDQQNGQSAQYTIYYPDGTVWTSWTQNFNATYYASWWYWKFFLPNPAPPGTWRFECAYNGQKATAYFNVNSSPLPVCALNNNIITSSIKGTTYQWQENSGSGFTNISNNSFYSNTNTNQLTVSSDAPTSWYGRQYRCFVDGSQYSQVISLKFTNYWLGNVSIAWEDPLNWSCGIVPDGNTDVVVTSGRPNYPEVNSNAICRSLSDGPGASVKVKTGFKLTITR